MSRGRFHAIAAIKKEAERSEGALDYWGIGWPDFDNEITVSQNLTRCGKAYDIVIGYMPFEMKGFSDVRSLRVMTYNEMYNFEKVSRQLEISRPHLVVCHHANEMPRYVSAFPDIHFENIPHSADPAIFYASDSSKTTDVLVVGRLSSERYPLRTRVSRLLERFPARYVCRVHPHPGYEISQDKIEECVQSYAQALRSSKICVTCSGTPRTRYAKYVEIPMSGALLCADIPDESEDFFRQFVLEIDMSMPDDEIVNKIVACLEDRPRLSALREKGIELSRRFTQAHYAESFLREAQNLLNKMGIPRGAAC